MLTITAEQLETFIILLRSDIDRLNEYMSEECDNDSFNTMSEEKAKFNAMLNDLEEQKRNRLKIVTE